MPIPGTNQVRNLELNIAAVDVEMTADEVGALSRVFAAGAGAGTRYAPSALKGL